VEPPKDSTDAIAFRIRSVQKNQSSYKVFSPIGTFIGEFQAEHIGELRNAMANAGLSRGAYMVKCGNAKTQRIVLR
jgi:glucuronoarabinoxylan endo-1,4-beta-xylanase